MSNNYVNKIKQKVYFAIFDNVQDKEVYNEAVYNIVRDFINCDNNIIKCRQNNYKIINSKISYININYDIKRKNTFNDNLEDSKDNLFNENISANLHHSF